MIALMYVVIWKLVIKQMTVRNIDLDKNVWIVSLEP